MYRSTINLTNKRFLSFLTLLHLIKGFLYKYHCISTRLSRRLVIQLNDLVVTVNFEGGLFTDKYPLLRSSTKFAITSLKATLNDNFPKKVSKNTSKSWNVLQLSSFYVNSIEYSKVRDCVTILTFRSEVLSQSILKMLQRINARSPSWAEEEKLWDQKRLLCFRKNFHQEKCLTKNTSASWTSVPKYSSWTNYSLFDITLWKLSLLSFVQQENFGEMSKSQSLWVTSVRRRLTKTSESFQTIVSGLKFLHFAEKKLLRNHSRIFENSKCKRLFKQCWS